MEEAPVSILAIVEKEIRVGRSAELTGHDDIPGRSPTVLFEASQAAAGLDDVEPRYAVDAVVEEEIGLPTATEIP